MEKQMKEETTMEENKKKNPDSERKSKLVSAILMAFVCVVMMGGGTYAWFTMNNVARVQSLKLNVASEGNLYISKANDFDTVEKTSIVTWFDANNTDVKTLYPCTTSDGVTMNKPVYVSDTEVNDKVEISSAGTEKNSYYLEQTFYLYLDDGLTDASAQHSDYSVQLAKMTGTEPADYDGTYFKPAEDDDEWEKHPEYCVRVSFTADNNTVVYEPNYDANNGAVNNDAKKEYATTTIAGYTAVSSSHTQNAEGNFVDQSDSNKVLGDSKELFTITGRQAKPVIVRVWFEGTDLDCCNNIELKDIMAQLKFVANKKETNP